METNTDPRGRLVISNSEQLRRLSEESCNWISECFYVCTCVRMCECVCICVCVCMSVCGGFVLFVCLSFICVDRCLVNNVWMHMSILILLMLMRTWPTCKYYIHGHTYRLTHDTQTRTRTHMHALPHARTYAHTHMYTYIYI